ncbi:hypothetical protein [Bdellovibrio sp. HCB209]|uniref:hypothetical protein n=1 Tax=Bdellovibrio sp. HCB209 TaxID=3394354 RepID=UPI0039B3D7B6
MNDPVLLLDIATSIVFWVLLGFSLKALVEKKSTRKLFSISLWTTWVTMGGLVILPEIYSKTMRMTLIAMLILLFVNSAEYRDGKQPKNTPQPAAE